MDHSLKIAVAQGLMGFCAACIIVSLTDRRSAPRAGALALVSSGSLSILSAHFLLGYGYVFSSIPLFGISFAICMVSNGAHMLSDREQRMVEGFLAWEDPCTCGASSGHAD
ncbi:hypothetical protein EON79_11240 [bacterium]|nr:MAG: hypothetical protein EON79_11240 [bacterium]